MLKIIKNEYKSLLTQQKMRLKFRDFLSECDNLSIKIHVNSFFEVTLTGDRDKTIYRLESLLDNEPELKAAVILHEATKNADLLDVIMERAAIRFSDGFSDSLFDAVLCSFKRLNETRKAEISRTDWQAELKIFE